ncbi:MAG: ABC transporter permease subunit [Christensenellaceae bacterium]
MKIGISLVTLALIIALFSSCMIRDTSNYALKLQNQQGITFDRAYELAAGLSTTTERKCLSGFRSVHGRSVPRRTRKFLPRNGRLREQPDCDRLPFALFISSVSLFISFFIGIAVGGFVAQKRKGVADKVASGYIAVSGSVPDYLIALILVIVFAYQLKWFPAQNNYDAFKVTPGFNLPFILNVLYYAFLPILSYTIVQTGNWILHMRGSCIGVLGGDYILAARARIERRTDTPQIHEKHAFAAHYAVSYRSGRCWRRDALESIFNYPHRSGNIQSYRK